MCPYYLDGDLTEPVGSVGDTRCHRGLSLRGGCGYCAVFKGRREGAGPADRHEGRPAGTGLSKLNSMHGLELGEMPRDARGAAAARVMRDSGWAGQVRSTF
jgi:hypothetical protein